MSAPADAVRAETDNGHDSVSFVRGVRAAVTWLHTRAGEMNDPHAQQILNAAATNLGWDLSRDRLPRSGDRAQAGEGYRSEAEGLAASLEQQADWIDSGVTKNPGDANRLFEIGDIDTDELRAAAALLRRMPTAPPPPPTPDASPAEDDLAWLDKPSKIRSLQYYDGTRWIVLKSQRPLNIGWTAATQFNPDPDVMRLEELLDSRRRYAERILELNNAKSPAPSPAPMAGGETADVELVKALRERSDVAERAQYNGLAALLEKASSRIEALTAATEAGKAEARREENEACALILVEWKVKAVISAGHADNPQDRALQEERVQVLSEMLHLVLSRISVQQDAGKEEEENG